MKKPSSNRACSNSEQQSHRSLQQIETSLSSKLSEIDLLLKQSIDTDPHYNCLSGIEKQVVKAILQGKTNREIAAKTGKVQRTIEYHRNKAMKKLNVTNISSMMKLIITRALTNS